MGKAKRTRDTRATTTAATPSFVRRFAPTLGVLVALLAVVGFGILRSDDGGTDGGGSDTGTSAALTSVTSLPPETFDAVGVPDAVRYDNIQLLPSDVPLVTRDGKPVVTYIGAEYCPFCAAERWALIVALGRFGTFEGLSPTTSGSAPEAYPDTATVTFHGSTYTSDYLVFSPAELSTRTGEPLDTMTPEQQRLFDTYNVDAVVGSTGAVPFTMAGNRFAWVGASYDVGLLEGRTFEEIAAAIADPADPIGQSIVGAANVLTGMFCRISGDKPADVCLSDGAFEGRAVLPGLE